MICSFSSFEGAGCEQEENKVSRQILDFVQAFQGRALEREMTVISHAGDRYIVILAKARIQSFLYAVHRLLDSGFRRNDEANITFSRIHNIPLIATSSYSPRHTQRLAVSHDQRSDLIVGRNLTRSLRCPASVHPPVEQDGACCLDRQRFLDRPELAISPCRPGKICRRFSGC